MLSNESAPEELLAASEAARNGRITIRRAGYNQSLSHTHMERRGMKKVWDVLGILLILAGGTFALQGLNVLLGSYMSGRTEWVYIGAATLVIGVVVLFLNNRRASR